MAVPVHVQARIEADIKKYVQLAERHFGRSYRVPAINYDLRGTIAGQAMGAHTVRFNAVLLMENIEDYIARTVPHEVAHIIDSANGDSARTSGFTFTRSGRARRVKRKIHGDSWKHIMRLFGVRDITRCHSYDVANALVKTKRKFEYKCNCCSKSILVSSVIHNRLGQGREYWCKKCGKGSRLIFVQNLGQRTFEQAEQFRDKHQERIAAETQAPRVPVVQEASMMDRARECYNTYRGVSRKEMIDIFVRRLGMKATTASTYYNTLKE